MKNRKRRIIERGITLIEMLVVITIIALFSAVAYQRLSPSVDKGRITAARTQIEAFAAALQTFHIDTGRFPTTEGKEMDRIIPTIARTTSNSSRVMPAFDFNRYFQLAISALTPSPPGWPSAP